MLRRLRQQSLLILPLPSAPFNGSTVLAPNSAAAAAAAAVAVAATAAATSAPVVVGTTSKH
jgi:hypothetical protein